MGFKASMCLQPLLHPIQNVGPAADCQAAFFLQLSNQSANVEVV